MPTPTPPTKASVKLGDLIIGRDGNNNLIVGPVEGINVENKTITVGHLPLAHGNVLAEGKYTLVSSVAPEVKIEQKKDTSGTKTFPS